MKTGGQLRGMSVKECPEACVSLGGGGRAGAALLMPDTEQRGRYPGGSTLGSQS